MITHLYIWSPNTTTLLPNRYVCVFLFKDKVYVSSQDLLCSFLGSHCVLNSLKSSFMSSYAINLSLLKNLFGVFISDILFSSYLSWCIFLKNFGAYIVLCSTFFKFLCSVSDPLLQTLHIFTVSWLWVLLFEDF